VVPPSGRLVHQSYLHTEIGMRPVPDLLGVHPETATRIDLERLERFDVERLEAPEDIYCFHIRSPEIQGDERLIVLADVVPAFERDFFEATRCMRNHLGVRDPRRRMQWNRVTLFAAISNPSSWSAWPGGWPRPPGIWGSRRWWYGSTCSIAMRRRRRPARSRS
jgi:hypothetical protein